MRLVVHSTFLFVFLSTVQAGKPGEPSELRWSQFRRAYYRGETASVTVSWSGRRGSLLLSGATLVLEAGEVVLARWKVPEKSLTEGFSRRLRFWTGLLRCGTYELVSTLRVGDTTRFASPPGRLVLARRPQPDRLSVWLWGGGGDRWYLEHGFTSWLGPYWKKANTPYSANTIARIEEGLLAGAEVGLTPNGGLRDVDPAWIQDPEARFTGTLGHYRGKKIANPFHPEVARFQNERNDHLMRFARFFPQIRTAFFNTEVVDVLGVNRNPRGKSLTRDVLGFDEEEIGDPEFVAPGVVADDDRKYLWIKFRYKQGNGLALANQRTAERIHRYRPDILCINDPFREVAFYDMFPGIDVVSTWTYTNPDPKLMLSYETLRTVCRPTGQIPMQTITLLNYPGEIAPTDEWMLMGEGRLRVATWIVLSRAPKRIGYYYSSACIPVGTDTFRVPYSTSLAIKELSEQVFRPFGPLLSRLEVAPRRIALLSSTVARIYGKSPRLRGAYHNLQPYHFYTVLAMAHLNADVLFDETIERFGLDNYDVLVLPKCDVLTESVYKEIQRFQKRGGILIADQYLGPSFDEVIRFDFDFTYRKKVNADAIAKNRTYAEWNDQLRPESAELAQVTGVSALVDQKILESYAATLKKRLAGIVEPEIWCDEPTVLLSELEKDGSRYLVAVNDRRTYDDRVGRYKAVLGKIEPQKATVRIRDWDSPDLLVYDLIEHRPIPVTKKNSLFEFSLELTELGGKILSLRERKLTGLEILVRSEVERGHRERITIRILEEGGVPAGGLLPMKVTLTDPAGRMNELSGFYCAEEGELALTFLPAFNDLLGKWRVEVHDLTAGRVSRADLTVVSARGRHP